MLYLFRVEYELLFIALNRVGFDNPFIHCYHSITQFKSRLTYLTDFNSLQDKVSLLSLHQFHLALHRKGIYPFFLFLIFLIWLVPKMDATQWILYRSRSSIPFVYSINNNLPDTWISFLLKRSWYNFFI